MYPAFILTLLTPLLFTAFTFVTLLFSYPCISYFTLIPFLFFMLCLILCCIISSYIRVSSYFYSSSLLHYYTFLREFDHANHEAYSTKTNTSCVNLMLYYDSRWQCFRYNCWSPLDCGMFRPERCFAPGHFARIGIYVCADKENWCPRDNFFCLLRPDYKYLWDVPVQKPPMQIKSKKNTWYPLHDICTCTIHCIADIHVGGGTDPHLLENSNLLDQPTKWF